MKKSVLFVAIVLLITSSLTAQVAINTTGDSPDPSAILDLQSTTKGFLVPRVTTADRNLIGTTQSGLMVYDTTTESFWYYDNTQTRWVELGSDTNSGWTISGDNTYSSVSGNVGIGTTNPSSKLQIRNGNLSLISQNADAYIKLSSDEEEDITPAYIWSENAKGFAVGSTPGTPQLLVNAATGKVGIGTSNPNQKLTIRGGNISAVSEGSDSFIYLGSDELGDAIGSYIWTDDNVGFSIGSAEGVAQLVVKNSNGNVGIGTTNPGTKLEVAGQIKITGGSPGAGKVLTSDADGISTWSSPTAYATSIDDLSDAVADAADLFLGDESGNNNSGLNFNTGVGIQALKSNTTGTSNTATGMGALQFNLTGYENTSNGHLALQKNTTGNANVAFGKEALLNNTTKSNLTAIGYQSLYNNGTGSSLSVEGIENTAVGSKTLYSNTLGSQNTAVGSEALKANTTGGGNTSTGAFSLDSNTEGDHNTATGAFALTSNTTAVDNTSFGYKSSYNILTGGYNSAFGSLALYATTTGTHNTAIGYTSLFKNTTGVRNTAVGVKALYNNTVGQRNTAIGNYALYSSDTTSNNIAIGDSTLYNTGTNITGSFGWEATYNVALGQAALKANTTGYMNTGIGVRALHNNSTGTANVAIGPFSLYSSTSGGSNIAIGDTPLYHNTTGRDNIAMGLYALVNNTEGGNNIALGRYAASDITTGTHNVAIGHEPLKSLVTGYSNIAIGTWALHTITGGNYNIAIGDGAGPLVSADFSNTIAIGRNAWTTADDQVRIGDWDITSIGGEVGWTTLSDGRFKTNVQENVAGLDFILKLRPVSYTVDVVAQKQFLGKEESVKQHGTTQSGFIAQEVEKAAQDLGFEFSGVDAPKNSNDYYGLRYGQFVVPLVKGIQEQQEQMNKLEIENADLKARIEKLEQLINK